MKNRSIAIWLLTSALVVPFSASAQKGSIYSWTDENGVKHFSDTAPPVDVEASSQPMAENQPGTDTDASSVTDTLNNQVMDSTAGTTADAEGEELSYADQQRKVIADRRAADEQKKADRNRTCLQARDQLARIEPSRRVFYTDENGNTTRLDDDERVRMVEDNQNLIDEYCD